MQAFGGSLFFSSIYFSFFIALPSSKDFIWVIATLFSSIRRSFYINPCLICFIVVNGSSSKNPL
jgi:hypothetical protein